MDLSVFLGKTTTSIKITGIVLNFTSSTETIITYTFYYCICKFEVFQRRAIRVVVVGYIGHYDSLSFLGTWMPFCVTKYYHVFVSFNLLCLKTLVPYDITFSPEIRQYIP
jgi:hypothetical protein